MRHTYIKPEMETLPLPISEMICGSGETQETIPGGNPDNEQQPGAADAKGVWNFDYEE